MNAESTDEDPTFSVFPEGYNWGGDALAHMDTKLQGWVMTQIVIGLQRVAGWSGMETVTKQELKFVIRDCKERAARIIDDLPSPSLSAPRIQQLTYMHRLRNAIINMSSDCLKAALSKYHIQVN